MVQAAGRADTTMGGDRSRFPSTSLSGLLAGQGDPAERLRRQLLTVAQAYWKPIYRYVRRAWSKSDADAKDLTQSFIIHVLEHDLVGRFDRQRGNFRTYLKSCLGSFLGTAARDASRLKRGGGRELLSIEGTDLGDVARGQESPDELFDREWAMETIERGLREVGEDFRAKGREICFRVFREIAIDAPPGGEPSYADVAARLGISESDVRNHLRVVRQELRRRILEAASGYVADEEGVFVEMAEILGRPQ